METTQKTQTSEITKISADTLAKLLCNITKSTICNITYLVDDTRSKTVKGIKEVQKLVNISAVYLNHDYTQKVINLSGDTSFVAQEMKGKSRVCSTLIQSDKTNELMLDGKVLNSESAKILAFFHNGKEITEAEAIALNLWTPSYYNPSEKTTMGRGLLNDDDNFRIINPYLINIKKIKLEGIEYEIQRVLVK